MPAWLLQLFGRFGYLVVFLGIFLENVGIPVPGETVLLAAGFLAKQHTLRIGLVILVAMLAAILGDNLGYFIGRRGGRVFALRYGKYVGLSAKRLSAVGAYYEQHGPRTIFFARFVSGIRVVAALLAGISEIPWTTFLLYNASGAVVWATTIGILGYLFGQSWHLLEKWVGRAGLFVAGAVVCIVLFAVLRRHRERITGAISDMLPGSVTMQELWLIGASLTAVGLFGKIAEDVVTREATPFDVAVAGAFARFQWPGVHGAMVVANAIGSAVAIILITIVALIWRLRRHDHLGAGLLLGLTFFIQLLDAVLKLSFHRVRPSPLHATTDLYSASFPSGHAMNAVAIYGFVAVLIARDWRGTGRIAAAAVTVIAVAIGAARVGLQLHWATDVLAGYAIGALLLLVAVFFLERRDAGQEAEARRESS